MQAVRIYVSEPTSLCTQRMNYTRKVLYRRKKTNSLRERKGKKHHNFVYAVAYASVEKVKPFHRRVDIHHVGMRPSVLCICLNALVFR